MWGVEDWLPPVIFSRVFAFTFYILHCSNHCCMYAKMEEENLNFARGEGEERADRKRRKGQVNAKRLAQMFGVSYAWINICKIQNENLIHAFIINTLKQSDKANKGERHYLIMP